MKNEIMPSLTHYSEPKTAAPLTPTSASSPDHDQDSKLMTWTGRVLSSIFVAFLLFASAAPKLLQLPIAETTMAELGWPAGYAFGIGLLELSCVMLYLVPRTALLGAVLTMGLLGGAMATQIRVQNPLFSHVLFTVYVGLFMWGGLWLRIPRLRALFPFMQTRRKH